MITADQLERAAGCTAQRAARFVEPLNITCERYDIATPARIAAFVAQLAHESGRFAHVVESLNYSSAALLITFGRHRISEADARRYGRDDGRPADQPAIANAIYGGVWGRTHLGNTQPGDGWRFRGRGLIQITGRANYRACGAGLGIDLEAAPETLEAPLYAALSAGWYWHTRNLNRLADAADMHTITRRINGGTHGLADRLALYRSAQAALA
jgi:putative chitinase